MLLKGRECWRTFSEIKQHSEKEYAAHDFKRAENFRELERVRDTSEWALTSSWSGGNWKDLIRQLNNGVDNFTEWSKSADYSVNIETKRNRRKRYWSDISGDIEIERRWDDRPFQAITRIPTQTHIIHLYVNANFNGWTTAETIVKYGINIFRVINALETAGRTVDLTVYFTSSSLYKSYRDRILMLVKVKEPGAYINPAIMAIALSPVFLRKAIFSEECLFAEEIGDTISYGHGRAENQLHKNITIAGDEVYVEPTNLSTFGEKELKELIQELVGANQVA